MIKLLRQVVLCGLLALFGVQQVVAATPATQTKAPEPAKITATKKRDAKTAVKRKPKLTAVEKKHLRDQFLKGYALFEKKKYSAACPYFFEFTSKLTPDDADYEWAAFFFGVCLLRMGYSHAAVDVIGHLLPRKPNPKIVTYCLEIFETLLREKPCDKRFITETALSDQDYGFVEGEMSDFVHYYQGLNDWERGLFEWGNQHFNQIRPWGHYFFKYLYQQALYNVYQDRIEDAIKILDQIVAHPKATREMQNEARKTLARLLYESGSYEDADFMYTQIQESILEQSENLLERAWAHYRMGHPEKAMGLLFSFEAPKFQDAFRPEYFILKSFIYKDVCHYRRALSVVNEFKSRYGDALKHVYERSKAEDNHALMLVMLSKPQINHTYRFLNLLTAEAAALEELEDAGMRSYLQHIYDLQMKESRAELRSQIDDTYAVIANNLLQYEEDTHLMEYEIGLDMYQRVSQIHFEEEQDPSVEKVTPRKVAVYNFQGEYWNDELATYQVELENRCKNMEEWDIFFK
jgi:tetratricopeptide (TPR) repeat protein